MNGWIWFNETIDCSIMDANQDCEMLEAQELNLINTESVDFSATYTNVEKMYWDVESDPPKYKTQVSVDQVLEETVTDESDTYDTSIYWTIINEWDAENIDGMIYIDHAQWNDTTLIYEEQPIDENDDVDIILDYTFDYERAIMNRDSLMFRENSDCNNDGQWTQAEDYDDVGSDGCPDVEEDGDGGCDGGGTGDDPNNDNWENGDDPVVKTEGNNEYNEGEPFTDREDNFIDAEIFWDENEDGERSPGEPYADLNCNGQYDDSAEIFWASGTAFITRKSIFENIGGFDETLFAHMEEIDFHWRSYMSGLNVYVEPKSIIYHKGGGTLNQNSSQKTYLNHRNSLILLLSNYEFLNVIKIFPLRLILEIISSIKDLLSLRIFHFIYHYISILSLFNIWYIFKRRKLVKKIRSIDDKNLFNKNIIYSKSIVWDYFVKKKYFFRDIIN